MADTLTGKERKILAETLRPDETVLFHLKGMGGQVLVALPERCVILKVGVLNGAAGGSNLTSFHYRDISAIDIHKFMVGGYVEILAAGMPRKGPKEKSTHAPNCLAYAAGTHKEMVQGVKRLREMVDLAKRSETQRTHVDLSTQLSELAGLHEIGVLSAEEFAQAKAKILAL